MSIRACDKERPDPISFAVTSQRDHLAGQVNITAIQHNFVDDPLPTATDLYLAAMSCVWYWRYAKNIDLNQNLTFENALSKINGNKSSTSAQGKSRRAHYNRIQEFMKAGNAYGNIGKLIGSLGLRVVNEDGYNTKFGLRLNQRPAVSIDPGPARLEAYEPSLSAKAEMQISISDSLKSHFEIQSSELNMLYLNLPDAEPVAFNEMIAAVAKSEATNMTRTVGICEFHWANTGENQPSSMFMDFKGRMLDMLPKDFVENEIRTKGISTENLKWLIEWSKGLDIKVITPPKHGEMLIDEKISKDHPSYRPNKGYIGKDRAEFLVSGKDLEGRAIFQKLVYFINVLPQKEMDSVVKKYNQSVKKYCGTTKPVWRISASDASTVNVSDLSSWQQSANLSALIANAQQTLTGFTDLPATALGQTAGEGATAAITLDQNAAGHGWYVDPTPLYNADDYLPTSQSGVWQAKAGTDAANRMDMLSVLLHEYGHALSLEHSAEAGDFMNASLQPGMRKMPTAEQLAQMSQLVAQLKAGDVGSATADHAGHDHEHDHDHLAHTEHDHDQPGSPSSPISMHGLLPFSFVRRNASSPTISNAGSGVSVRTHDYMTAVNPTLVNGKFHLGANTGANGGANGLNGWESFGAVTTAQEAANTAACTAGHVKSPINLRAIC